MAASALALRPPSAPLLLLTATSLCLAAILFYRRRRRNSQQSIVSVFTDTALADAALQSWHRAIARGDLQPVLGLDTEWVRKKRPVALVQISCYKNKTREIETIILRLTAMDAPPRSLLALLADASIAKCGVGISDDLLRLEKAASNTFTAAGGVELVSIAKRLGFTSSGLASLCLEVLHETLPKDPKVRCSNWEADELSSQQLEYAANDARASLRLLLAFYDRARASGSIAAWAMSDALPAARHSSNGEPRGNGGSGNNKGNNIGPRVPPRTKPLYDGWLMLGPDGLPMCRMAASRARWYVSRHLAEEVPIDDPRCADAPGRTIQLTFTPNGRGNITEPWLLQGKANVCVGCGSEAEQATTEEEAEEEQDASARAPRGDKGGNTDLRTPVSSTSKRHVRFGVVPHSFRRWLPSHMKSRDSHDIVLLCVSCYRKLEPAYEAHRASTFRRYDVQRQPNQRADKHEIASATERREERIRSWAVALTAHGDKLPASRREVLLAQLAGEAQVEVGALTEAVLMEMAQRTKHDCRQRQKVDTVTPEQRLLDAVVKASKAEDEEEEAALHAFCQGWRKLFVETLKPSHLPAGWRTDHRR